MRMRSGFLVLTLALVLAVALPLQAQQTTGTLRGRILDPDGQPLPGVTVTVSGDALIGGSRSTVTGVSGGYNLAALPPGTYSIRAEITGFRTYVQEGLVIALGGATTINATLELSAVEETITVTGEAPVVDVTSSSLSTNFTADFIDDLPTMRNIPELIQIAPGMSASYKPGNSDRTVAFGSNQQSNNWQVDGIEVTAPETGSSWSETNFAAVEEIQVLGVGAPAEYGNVTGAVFNVVTKRGGNEFHGTANYFGQPPGLTGTNVVLTDTPYPSFERLSYNEASATIGGPIKKDAIWFFASGRYRRDDFAEPRTDPDVVKPYKNDTIDMKLSSRLGENHDLDIKGAMNWYDSPYYVGPTISPESSSGEYGTSPQWSINYRGVLSDTTFVQARYSGWWASDYFDSATGSTLPGIYDATPLGGGPAVQTQGVLWPWGYETWTNQASADMSTYAQDFLGGDHDFKFGVQYSYGGYDTQVSAGPTGTYYYQYTYRYYGAEVYEYPYWYQVVQNPFFYGGRNTNLAAFLDDSWNIGDSFTLNLGVRVDYVKGNFPEYPQLAPTGYPSDGKKPVWDTTGVVYDSKTIIDETFVSPRVGFAWTPTDSGRTVVRGSWGIYRDGNVGGNWNYPPPGVTPYEFWYLPNYPSLEGRELSFSDLPENVRYIDGLRIPQTTQYSIGLEQEMGRDMSIGAQYVYKSGENLIGWHIEGGTWEPVPYTDPHTGNQFTLLKRITSPLISKGNGPGFTAAGEIDQYWQKYSGFVLTFKKRFSDNWSLQASYTYSKSWGLIPRMLSQVQFNPFYGSTEGSNPNNYINAEQRLQADRPHMFRVQGSWALPANFNLGAMVNMQSGRAHNRQITVSGGIIGAGTQVIMSPAGENDPCGCVPTNPNSTTYEDSTGRLPFNTMVDLSLGWSARLGGSARFLIDAQIFNLFNDSSNTFYETLRIPAGAAFSPDEFQWPRRMQIRAGFEF